MWKSNKALNIAFLLLFFAMQSVLAEGDSAGSIANKIEEEVLARAAVSLKSLEGMKDLSFASEYNQTYTEEARKLLSDNQWKADYPHFQYILSYSQSQSGYAWDSYLIEDSGKIEEKLHAAWDGTHYRVGSGIPYEWRNSNTYSFGSAPGSINFGNGNQNHYGHYNSTKLVLQ